MNARSCAQIRVVQREVLSPVDPSAYDRSPVLRNAERAALEEVRRRSKGSGLGGVWPRRLERALGRFVIPMRDVLSAIGADTRNRSLPVGMVLEGMHRRQSAMWGWTREEWQSILVRDDHKSSSRQSVAAIAYLLCGRYDVHLGISRFSCRGLAERAFGREAVAGALEEMCAELEGWGYAGQNMLRTGLQQAGCSILLLAGSPRWEDVSYETIYASLAGKAVAQRHCAHAISRVLADKRILRAPLPGPDLSRRKGRFEPVSPEESGVPDAWARWAKRWYETSTFTGHARKDLYLRVLMAGRWLAAHHPEVTEPGQWTRGLAAEFVAAVDRLRVGELASTVTFSPEKAGKPLAPATKKGYINAVRVFFRDGMEWGWFPKRFDPIRSFATPRTILAGLGPDPRTIQDDIWAKLLWAGLNLTAEDVSATLGGRGSGYPLEMVRAIAVAWLFCGLRSDELRRLRLGCVEWQGGDELIPGTSEMLPKDAVCQLHVPVNKTSRAFIKPVDRVVGEALLAWERLRPKQSPALDPKTGEMVQFLFSVRNRRMGKTYLNKRVIPLLCGKSGVPTSDARGNITSHRARSTIASQLANAKEPMSLLELKEWLGHAHVGSTMRYVRTSQTKLAKAYADAGYFARNVRAVEVLIDQEVVRSGAAANGEPWKHYDLGHGYCHYDFFEQCPHRMACARCDFYVPKGSSKALLLEGKSNLARMRQEIPLSEEELAAVDDGIGAHERLLEKLVDVPTPAGPTPRQLGVVPLSRKPAPKSRYST